MQSLILVQEDRFENLEKAERNYRKTPKERLTKGYSESRLESLEALWSEFKSDHRKIVAQATKDIRKDLAYFTEDLYEQFEELYTTYKSILKNKLEQFKPTTQNEKVSISNSGSCSAHNEVHLPSIKLPSFNGKYNEWQSFHDLFDSLIHNNSKLKSVQKLHYLKSCLSGEPEVLLHNLTITDANYEEAWLLLKQRYDNKRFNCNAILKSLFSIKQTNHESASALKLILDTTSSCLKQLKNLGIDVESWDSILIYIVVSKLDAESHKQWEIQMSHLAADEMPQWNQLTKFLEARFRALEMIDTNKTKNPVQNNQNNQSSKPKSFHTSVGNQDKRELVCALCEENHHLFACKKFGMQQPKERQDFVQAKGLCFNCLAPFHSVKNCRLATSCQKCGRRHHTLLHYNKEAVQGFLSTTENLHLETNNTEKLAQPSTSLGTETRIISNFAKEKLQPNEVLLATALVKTRAKNGCEHHIRCLLDQGSQASFITEDTIQLLGLKRSPVEALVSGLGSSATRVRYMVTLHVESRQNPKKSIQVDAYVLRSFSWVLPSSNLTSPDFLEFGNLVLADPGYTTSSKIDLLLGAEVYSKILTEGIIKHPRSNLIAQNTIFGWTISGEVSNNSNSQSKRLLNMHLQIRKENKLKQSQNIETEINNTIYKKITTEEIKSVNLSTSTRDNDGRYVVLPFEKQTPDYEEKQFEELTLKKFNTGETILSENSNQNEEYQKVLEEEITLNKEIQKVLDEQITLNHMDTIEKNEEIRYSAEVSNHQHADIREDKMYDQVKVHEKDTKYQRNYSQPIQSNIKSPTRTFGINCELNSVKKCLPQEAIVKSRHFPIAPDKVVTDFHDDNLTSKCGFEEVVEILCLEMIEPRQGSLEDTKPEYILQQSLCFKTYIVSSKNLKIPMKIQLIDNLQEMHTCNDATRSSSAATGHIHMSLIRDKNKIASIEKEITISGLKFCSLFLVARLLYEMFRIFKIPKIDDLYRWSSSVVTLTWLRDFQNYCMTFVSNQISKINNIIEYEQWLQDQMIEPDKPDFKHGKEKIFKTVIGREETENKFSIFTKVEIFYIN